MTRGPSRRASRPDGSSTSARDRRRRAPSIGRRLGLVRPARRRRGRAPSARRRTASASCRCGSRRPAPRSRTAGPARSTTGRSPGEPCGSAASGPTRQATSNASASAPPVRMSHSRRSASVVLGDARPDLRQQRRQRPVRDRARRRDALELGRLLDRPVRLDPALDRDELDVRRRGLQARPQRVRHEPRLDRDPRRADATRRAPASARQVVVRPRRSARPGASRRAWIV